MKVYFTSSDRGIGKLGSFYKRIYKKIQLLGFDHLDNALEKCDESFYLGSYEDRVAEYKKAAESVRLSDIVFLEISVHSLSMGYVLHQALQLEKPVICFYYKDVKPYFVEVIENEKIFLFNYDSTSLEEVVEKSIKNAQKSIKKRFRA